MKIGLVCPYNMFRGGGVQECVLALQAELNKRGHTARIITPKPREHTNGTSHDDLILIGRASDVKLPIGTTAQFSVNLDNTELAAMLAREKFDVLHFHEPWVPMVSRQILARSQCANVATFHAKLPGTIVTRTLEKVVTPYTKSVLRHLHELSAVSEAAAEYIHTLTKKPVTIIPNGVDIAKYAAQKRKNETSEPKTILYIGRLEKRKGVKYLLKAYASLSAEHTDMQLILIGEGPDRTKLEQFVHEHKIPNVTFKGFVSEAEKLHDLAHADLFCSPALYGESFGIVLLEAMAAGCVTVAGNNPGYSSVLSGVGSLSLVNPKNLDEFSQRLELLLYNPAVRSMWREWASDHVANFSYAKVVDQYEDLYKTACKAFKSQAG